ncbi:MAG: hypothetical protein RIR55_1854 [Bacteroidota bacterium]
MKITIKYILILMLFFIACKEKYISPVTSPATGYLVVEGAINSGIGATNITLSRTAGLQIQNIVYEKGAIVKVEGEDNTSKQLTEVSDGNYTISGLNLNANKKYRLNITTKDGKVYLSDFSSVIYNPPIDSINWKRENGSVQMYVNTHDDTNNTQYYQWETSETWEIHSGYLSALKYKQTNSAKGTVYSVDFSDSINKSIDYGKYYCWKTVPSSQILTGTTVALSKNIINLPIANIPQDSWKLNVLYSLFTRQLSISKGKYEFLQRMKKNTEGTGSIFDAQPSDLNGNLHCVSNTNEPVIGYIDVCNIQEKRIFISRNQVPDWNYYQGCNEIKITNNSDSIQIHGLYLLPTYPETNPMTGAIISFFAAPPECVDCRLRGSNIKPSFWP